MSAWAGSVRKDSAKKMAMEVETSSGRAKVKAKIGTAFVESLSKMRPTSSWWCGFVRCNLME